MSEHRSEKQVLSTFEDKLLTTREAAAYLTVSPSTLAYWRATGWGPKYVRLGCRSVRYRQLDLSAYVAERQNRRFRDASGA